MCQSKESSLNLSLIILAIIFNFISINQLIVLVLGFQDHKSLIDSPKIFSNVLLISI